MSCLNPTLCVYIQIYYIHCRTNEYCKVFNLFPSVFRKGNCVQQHAFRYAVLASVLSTKEVVLPPVSMKWYLIHETGLIQAF